MSEVESCGADNIMWNLSSSILTKNPSSSVVLTPFNQAKQVSFNLAPERGNWLVQYFSKNRINKPSSFMKTSISLKNFFSKRSYSFLCKHQSNSSLYKTQNFFKKENFEISTIRNSSFDFSINNTFTKIVLFADLPFFFDKGLYNVLRYAASFYGTSSDVISSKGSLWLTMHLKKNVEVPFGLFFRKTQLRRNFFSSINKKSWNKYNFLLKNSFIKSYSLSLNYCENFYIHNKNNYFFFLTDLSHYLRRTKFKYHRKISLVNDIDFSISTYHATFEYFDLRQRAIFYWISNNSLLRDSAFFIRGFDPSVILYPQRFFKYKAYEQLFTKFHKSWFFLDKVNQLTSDLFVQKNLINILIELVMKQIWTNFNIFFNFDEQFINFRLLLFIIMKNLCYSKVLILFNRMVLKESSLYVFFLNNNFISTFNKNFTMLNSKLNIYNYSLLKLKKFFKRNIRFASHWLKKFKKNSCIISKNHLRNFYIFNRFKFINRYYMFPVLLDWNCASLDNVRTFCVLN